MTALRICCYCDRSLGASYVTITVHSASGARPDQHAHQSGDRECRQITAAEREGRSH